MESLNNQSSVKYTDLTTVERKLICLHISEICLKDESAFIELKELLSKYPCPFEKKEGLVRIKKLNE